MVNPSRATEDGTTETIEKVLRLNEALSVSDMRKMAHVILLLLESDAAKSNISLFKRRVARKYSRKQVWLLIVLVLCFVHQMHIVSSSIMEAAHPKKKLCNDLYCCSMFVRRVQDHLVHLVIRREHSDSLVGSDLTRVETPGR